MTFFIIYKNLNLHKNILKFTIMNAFNSFLLYNQ